MKKKPDPVKKKAPVQGYFLQRDAGRWRCLGSPSNILDAISRGGVPVRKDAKEYYTKLARSGVTRNWFSYEFIPNESMEAYLKTLPTGCVDTGGRR